MLDFGKARITYPLGQSPKPRVRDEARHSPRKETREHGAAETGGRWGRRKRLISHAKEKDLSHNKNYMIRKNIYIKHLLVSVMPARSLRDPKRGNKAKKKRTTERREGRLTSYCHSVEGRSVKEADTDKKPPSENRTLENSHRPV